MAPRPVAQASALVGVLLLGACAARPPAAPVVDAGPPPGVDGRYRGTARLVRSNDQRCPRSGPRVYDVVGGVVTVAYSGNRLTARSAPSRVQLTAPIQSNGTLQASDGVGTLDGTLSNGTLEFTISSALCEHRWTLRQVN